MYQPSFYYWATFISLPQLLGCSSMASGQKREQIRESDQPSPPNFAQLFLPLTIFWRAWHLLLSVIYFMIFAYFIVRVNQRRRPHKQRLLIVTFLFFIRFSFKLMQIILVSGLQLESFSGTPWLLDVLNGFIAHNNVSNLRLFILGFLLSQSMIIKIPAPSLLLHFRPAQRVQRSFHLPPVHREEGGDDGFEATLETRSRPEWSASHVLGDQSCRTHPLQLH